mmetsp:Transcript_9112/g.12074  ORF Transcript_9112/g.12074 Transcript_9112/m.12074 type:complete len:399 (-) Transcript_9112:185-1381(-)
MGSGVSTNLNSEALTSVLVVFDGKPIDASDVVDENSAKAELLRIYEEITVFLGSASDAGFEASEIDQIKEKIGNLDTSSGEEGLPAMVQEIARIRKELSTLVASAREVIEQLSAFTSSIEQEDVWATLSIEEQWKLFEEEAVHVVTSEDNNPDISAVVEDAKGEDSGPYYLKLEALSINAFDATKDLTKQIVGLDLPGNELTQINFEASNNLRILSLASNPLESLPKLSGCNRLLNLDLSYCELEYTSEFFTSISQLHKLVLDGCGISSLTDEENQSIFSPLQNLRILSLQENEFEDLDSLQGLNTFTHSHLVELNLKENEVCTSVGVKVYKDKILQMVPSLRMLDDLSLQVEGMTTLQNVKNLKQDVERNGTLMDNPNLEKEVQDAMAGKSDNTVVS